jgi:hypothetical protein
MHSYRAPFAWRRLRLLLVSRRSNQSSQTASLKHIGLIEPLVVYPRGPGDYLLLEGHMRLERLKCIVIKEAKCLLLTNAHPAVCLR